jgi:hypothetical protein
MPFLLIYKTSLARLFIKQGYHTRLQEVYIFLLKIVRHSITKRLYLAYDDVPESSAHRAGDHPLSLLSNNSIRDDITLPSDEHE